MQKKKENVGKNTKNGTNRNKLHHTNDNDKRIIYVWCFKGVFNVHSMGKKGFAMSLCVYQIIRVYNKFHLPEPVSGMINMVLIRVIWYNLQLLVEYYAYAIDWKLVQAMDVVGDEKDSPLYFTYSFCMTFDCYRFKSLKFELLRGISRHCRSIMLIKIR